MKKNEEQKNSTLKSSDNSANLHNPDKTEVKNANASGQGAFERSGEDLDKIQEEEADDDQVY